MHASVRIDDENVLVQKSCSGLRIVKEMNGPFLNCVPRYIDKVKDRQNDRSTK
jgi:hypothetical protein